MKVTYLDLKTGLTATETGISAYSLMEGNWSCDCNRALAFGNDNISEFTCDGAKRYIVIDVKQEKMRRLKSGAKVYSLQLKKEIIIKNANEEYFLALQAITNKKVQS